MNKKTLKIISDIAEKMPPKQYMAAHENQRITGSEVLLSGIKEIKGHPIDPEKHYNLKVPVIRMVDHKSRMKKIYKNRGKTGIITYLRSFIQPNQF